MSNSADHANVMLPADCPPDGAVAPRGRYFRLTSAALRSGDVPSGDDWVLPFLKKKGECAGRPELCDCHAHSVFSDLDDVHGARKASAWVRSALRQPRSHEPPSGRSFRLQVPTSSCDRPTAPPGRRYLARTGAVVVQASEGHADHCGASATARTRRRSHRRLLGWTQRRRASHVGVTGMMLPNSRGRTRRTTSHLFDRPGPA